MKKMDGLKHTEWAKHKHNVPFNYNRIARRNIKVRMAKKIKKI
jgi:hypothetical protein